MTYVVGILNDGNEVLLINDNPLDPSNGMYNGLSSISMPEETPEESLSYRCYQTTRIVVDYWEEIETVQIDDDSNLIYFSGIISADELNKIKDLENNRIFFFNKQNLPTNIEKQLAFHINNRLKYNSIAIDKNDNNIFRSYLYVSLVTVFFLCLVFLVVGKVTKDSFLYYFTSDSSYNSESQKTKEFQNGFNERIKSSY